MKRALLIIDPQTDFCLPAGSLFVPGADADIERLCVWINQNASQIDQIFCTQDVHPRLDIAHPQAWVNTQQEHPQPFTQITAADVHAKKWVFLPNPQHGIWYLSELEKQGQFPHIIWPEHCLENSQGAEITPALQKSLYAWAKHQNKDYECILKGQNPNTEHFGIFRANIILPNAPDTDWNKSFIDELNSFDEIYLAGEARSHCVANSLSQAMEFSIDFAQKFIILEDCMSNVPGFETIADPIYEKATKLGIRSTSSKVSL